MGMLWEFFKLMLADPQHQEQARMEFWNKAKDNSDMRRDARARQEAATRHARTSMRPMPRREVVQRVTGATAPGGNYVQIQTQTDYGIWVPYSRADANPSAYTKIMERAKAQTGRRVRAVDEYGQIVDIR